MMITRTAAATSALLVLVPAMFASNMAIARWFDGQIPPMTLACLRWLIAAGILSIIIRRHIPSLMQLRAQAGLLTLLTVLGGVLSVAPQYVAANHTQAGHIALIFATSPLMVSFIERLIWGTPLRLSVLAGSVVAFAGLLLVVSAGDPMALLTDNRLNVGDGLALMAALAWAGYTALARRHQTGLAPMEQLWVLALGSGLLLIPAAGLELASGRAMQITPATVLGVFALASVAGVGAYAAYGALIERLGPARAAMSMYLIPLWTLFLAAVFLDESLHLYHMAAITLILAGLALSGHRRAPKALLKSNSLASTAPQGKC